MSVRPKMAANVWPLVCIHIKIQ